MFAEIPKETLPKRKTWVNIESLVYLTLEYLSIESLVYLSKNYQYHYHLRGVRLWLVNNQGAVKKKNAYLCQHQGHMNKMDSQYLGNYVWIYAYTSDLDQGVVLWGIWFLCGCDN